MVAFVYNVPFVCYTALPDKEIVVSGEASDMGVRMTGPIGKPMMVVNNIVTAVMIQTESRRTAVIGGTLDTLLLGSNSAQIERG